MSNRNTALRDECDRLFGLLIREIHRNSCCMCGATEALHVSHITGRGKSLRIRWSPVNALLLCAKHHADLDGVNGTEARLYMLAEIMYKLPRIWDAYVALDTSPVVFTRLYMKDEKAWLKESLAKMKEAR